MHRNGKIDTLTYGPIDNLLYAYNGNQLLKVDDDTGADNQANGFKDNGSYGDIEYLYDANGNMIKDDNKDIANITYNHLNLPEEIEISPSDPHFIKYTYDAAGIKLRKSIDNEATYTDYVGSFVYENDELKFILTDYGKIMVDINGIDTTYTRHYNITDHLGNTRITFTETGQVIQEDSYYPFGMAMSGLNFYANYLETENKNNYLYNGKELQEEFGLEWYDYGARMYDAQLGRWHVVDPLAEQAYSWTSYRYSFNNPINLIDPDGRFEFKWNKDKDGNNTSLALNKSTDKDAPDQNMETFISESGLSKRQVNKLFGGKDEANAFFNGDEGSVNVSDLQGKMGEKLQQIETSILEYNNEAGLENSNCGGASISLATNNEIDRNSTLGFGSGLPLKEFSMEANLVDFTKTKLDKPKMGDVRIYTSKDGRWHAATFLLKNHKKENNTQVWYKRDGTSQGKYMINTENAMRSSDGYDGVIDGNYRKTP